MPRKSTTRHLGDLFDPLEKSARYARLNALYEGAADAPFLDGARAVTDAAYRAIIKRAEALIEVNGAEGYEQFVNMVNAIVAKFSVKKPHHHNKHGADGTTDEEAGA